MPRLIVTPGDRYGRLSIVNECERHTTASGRTCRMFTCRCDCGSEVKVKLERLRSGHTRSCGCVNRELGRLQFTTHGKSSHPLFMVWSNMKRRCLSKAATRFYRYGARGISVCKEWSDSFEVFYEWAIAHGWKPTLEIDRKNNDDHYKPSNCRFVTTKVNSRNTSRNVTMTLGGETLCIGEWSERIGVKYHTLYGRRHLGWSDERALTTPVGV